MRVCNKKDFKRNNSLPEINVSSYTLPKTEKNKESILLNLFFRKKIWIFTSL